MTGLAPWEADYSYTQDWGILTIVAASQALRFTANFAYQFSNIPNWCSFSAFFCFR